MMRMRDDAPSPDLHLTPTTASGPAWFSGSTEPGSSQWKEEHFWKVCYCSHSDLSLYSIKQSSGAFGCRCGWGILHHPPDLYLSRTALLVLPRFRDRNHTQAMEESMEGTSLKDVLEGTTKGNCLLYSKIFCRVVSTLPCGHLPWLDGARTRNTGNILRVHDDTYVSAAPKGKERKERNLIATKQYCSRRSCHTCSSSISCLLSFFLPPSSNPPPPPPSPAMCFRILFSFSFAFLPHPHHCSLLILVFVAFLFSRRCFSAFFCIQASELHISPHFLGILQAIAYAERQSDEDFARIPRGRGRIRNHVVRWYVKRIGNFVKKLWPFM